MGRCYYRDGLHGRSRKAAVDVATPSPAPKPYPLLAAAQPRQLQRAGFAAGTATINREKRINIREEARTSRSSPLARARAARWQRSTSRRAPAPTA